MNIKKKKKKSIILRSIDSLVSIFIEGLLVLLPIAVTLGLLGFFFRLVKSWLSPIYNLEPEILKAIPQSEIILVGLFIFIVGLVFKLFLLDKLLDVIEYLLSKIPLLRPIYFGIKQLVQAFTIKDKVTFQKIAYIEFPRPGIYSLGFITNEITSKLAPDESTKYYSVFIPTTPNPTTGYFVAVKDTECIFVDITKQEAMAIIISGGIIQPERFQEKLKK